MGQLFVLGSSGAADGGVLDTRRVLERGPIVHALGVLGTGSLQRDLGGRVGLDAPGYQLVRPRKRYLVQEGALLHAVLASLPALSLADGNAAGT